jgi:hypothetical protein
MQTKHAHCAWPAGDRALPPAGSPGIGVHLVGRQLSVVPETPDRNVEVVLRASMPSGEPLPDLEVNVPKGSVPFTTLLDERYRDATVRVIDSSPFPRTCAFATEWVVPMSALPVPWNDRAGTHVPSAPR